ncbi:MAG: 1-acyl-sn-glycerol-3-phosphate acyltransferase, partial [Bacteroidota bacterium]
MFQHEGKIYPHIMPDISKWAIYQASEDRAEFVEEVKAFSMARIQELHGHELPDVLGKTTYSELKRTKEEPWKVDPPKERKYWKRLSRRLANQSLDETEASSAKDAANELTEEVVERYAQEIVATFKIGTFKFARGFLSIFLGRLLNTADGKWIQGWFRGWFGEGKSVRNRLLIKGYVDQMRGLCKKGTVILVPTHFSNLDSLVISYAMEQVAGVPISTYGAGLNLFNTGYTAYFMNRLGVYRIDRRKKNPIYLNTLKANCVKSILRGVPNLFFPGGTRSRSGAIETKLKLGLVGTAIEAQRIHYERGTDQKIFIVPVILSYPFVLEAKYLIEQHLRIAGKERYIASKDSFHSLRAIIKFIWGLFSKGNQLTISLGKPMDVLGNFVDDNGDSYQGDQQINTKDYFLAADGRVSKNLQREQEYTRILGERILERFHADNVVLASHLVSYAAFICLE